MCAALMEPIAPSPGDIKLAQASRLKVEKLLNSGLPVSVVTRDNGKESELVEIPRSAVPIIKQILAAMEKGSAIVVMPVEAHLTTQQAADLLGVSRPFIIKLIDEKKLGCRKVGRHRRILLKELLEYKQQSYSKGQKILDELAEDGQAWGIGY